MDLYDRQAERIGVPGMQRDLCQVGDANPRHGDAGLQPAGARPTNLRQNDTRRVTLRHPVADRSLGSGQAASVQDVPERGGGAMNEQVSLLVTGSPDPAEPRVLRALAREFALVEWADDTDGADRLLPRCHFDCIVVHARSPRDPALGWITRVRQSAGAGRADGRRGWASRRTPTARRRSRTGWRRADRASRSRRSRWSCSSSSRRGRDGCARGAGRNPERPALLNQA